MFNYLWYIIIVTTLCTNFIVYVVTHLNNKKNVPRICLGNYTGNKNRPAIFRTITVKNYIPILALSSYRCYSFFLFFILLCPLRKHPVKYSRKQIKWSMLFHSFNVWIRSQFYLFYIKNNILLFENFNFRCILKIKLCNHCNFITIQLFVYDHNCIYYYFSHA